MSGTYGYEGDGSAAPFYGGGGYAAGNYSRGGGGGDGDNSQNRGDGRGGGSSREGDWICPNTSCGNSNFARRTECNRCGTSSPTSGGNRGGGNYGNHRSGSGGGGYNGNQSGNYGGGKSGNYDGGKNVFYGGNKERDGGGRGGSYSGNQEKDVGGRGRSYGSNQERDNNNNRNPNYGTNAVPPPTSYIGGPNSYPPSYGGPVSYAGENMGGTRGGGRFGGYDRGYNGQQEISDGAPVKVKQCDEKCDETCDNSRIYISNLPLDVTVEELRDLFGGIGQVGRIKQKRGYKDQWPWNIKLYTDDNGKNKGDAVLSYEDPSAAHSAGGFYNGYVIRGCTIKVAMAEKSALKAPPAQSGRGGGRGGYSGGGDRRSYNNRDDRGGPDRNRHGGNRSQPY